MQVTIHFLHPRTSLVSAQKYSPTVSIKGIYDDKTYMVPVWVVSSFKPQVEGLTMWIFSKLCSHFRQFFPFSTTIVFLEQKSNLDDQRIIGTNDTMSLKEINKDDKQQGNSQLKGHWIHCYLPIHSHTNGTYL